MAKPAKKTTVKKAAKKPGAGKPAAVKAKPGRKAAEPTPPARPAEATADDRAEATPYTPKPIDGIGWPAFRYPLQ